MLAYPKIAHYASPLGVITRGCQVWNVASEAGEGQVTDIFDTAEGVVVEVCGRYTDKAERFALSLPADEQGEVIADQALCGVVSGAYEIRLPSEGNRVYFAQSAEQVVAFLGLKIGVSFPERERLTRQVEQNQYGGVEVPFRGTFGQVGELAYVRAGQPRPAPRLSLGQQAKLKISQGPMLIVGLALWPNPLLQGPRDQFGWHYFFALAGGTRVSNPMAETLLDYGWLMRQQSAV